MSTTKRAVNLAIFTIAIVFVLATSESAFERLDSAQEGLLSITQSFDR